MKRIVLRDQTSLEDGIKRIEECPNFPMGADRFANLVGSNHMAPRRAAVRLGLASRGKVVAYSKETALRIWTEMRRTKTDVIII